jgi:hypothetical protein
MKDVALLLRMGTGEEGAAGDPGPGVFSPGVPGGVLTVSFIMTAGLPGRVREEIETEATCEAIASSSGNSSSKEPVLSYPSPEGVPDIFSSFLRRSRSFMHG